MKKLFIQLFAVVALISNVAAQDSNYQLSSHILDVSTGNPAPDITIKLSKLNTENTWVLVDEKITDKNGRVKDFLIQNKKVSNTGIYKLTYFTKPYFAKQSLESFYPFIEVVFEIKDDNHYHVPITLSPFGYSTYRGN